MKISEEVHERLTKLGIKDSYSNIVKYLLEVYDSVESKKVKVKVERKNKK